MKRIAIHTQNAPTPVGPYSQAIKCGNCVYVAGQLHLDPRDNELVRGDFAVECRRVFDNIEAVAEAAGGSIDNVVRLAIYLTNLQNFSKLNEVMAEYFSQPYPARTTVGVSSLPLGADIEVEAVLAL